MKRRLLIKKIAMAFCIVLAFSIVIAVFTIAFPKKYVPVFIGAACVAGVAVIGLCVCLFFYMRPDNSKKKLQERYSSLPAEKITDFKAELDGVRKNYAADSDPNKNKIEEAFISEVDYTRFFRHTVLKTGGIYYGCLVEANKSLFKKNAAGLGVFPAVIVYSTDEYYEQNPYELKKIAEYLYENKNDNVLGNERDYVSNMRIKDPVTDGREVYITTVFVYSPHLPFGYITGSLFPVIARPETSTSVFIVDCKYWTDGIVANFMYKDLSRPDGEPFKEFPEDGYED